MAITMSTMTTCCQNYIRCIICCNWWREVSKGKVQKVNGECNSLNTVDIYVVSAGNITWSHQGEPSPYTWTSAGTAINNTDTVVGGYTYKQGSDLISMDLPSIQLCQQYMETTLPWMVFTDDTANITRPTRLELSLKILPDQVEYISVLD